MRKKLVGSLAIGLCLVGMVASVQATTFSIDTIDGDWRNPVPSNVTIQNDIAPNGRLAKIRWGTPTTFNGSQSGYDFLTQLTPLSVNSDGTAFALGTFTHQNWPISGTFLESVDLRVRLVDAEIPNNVFNIQTIFSITHNETDNSGPGNCCNDLVTVTNPIVNQLFTYNSQNYYFNLMGFSQNGGSTITTAFSTIEGQANTAVLYAKITEAPVTNVPEPASLLLLGSGLVGLGFWRRREANNA